MAEINTDNLVLNLFTSGEKGYPITPDNKNSKNIVWYQQDSYNKGMCPNETLKKLFSTASKSLSGREGKAEFVVDTPNFYIVIEDKDITSDTMFSGYDDITEYIGKGYSLSRLYKCPIDDVLWYAEHLKLEKDVIAIANYSDGKIDNFKSATFFYPKNGTNVDIKLVCSGGYREALLSVEEYTAKIENIKGIIKYTYEEIYDELRKYAEISSRFLYKTSVDDSDRLGLVSIVALALTNKKSTLFNKVSLKKDSNDTDNTDKLIGREDIVSALLEANDKTKYGVIVDPEKGLPADKIATLTEYINRIMNTTLLTNYNESILKEWDAKDKSEEKFFANGADTILSRVTYSLYNNIIKKYEKYRDKGIDIMGTFYSLFLVYYASDKKKGIVLTPNHITSLFCDIAEYFRGKPIDKETIILDICTGSGGFLIAALNYIDKSIDEDDTLTESQKQNEKKKARKNCLIGVEQAPSMFMLAYANMNFHGDGSSRLYNLNSLLSNVYDGEQTFGSELCKLYDFDGSLRKKITKDIEGKIEKNKKEEDKDYENRIRDLVIAELFKKNGADIGMINPPYGKDFNEYDFINAELKYLKEGGIGLAIVPVSNQGASKDKDKIALLENHSLLASILMPLQLFTNICNSGASVGTCILVFKAHQPHKYFLEDGGRTFLADWREAGFKIIAKHGRFEDKNRWFTANTGYRDMYLKDMNNTIGRDTFSKEITLRDAYNTAFPEEKISEQATMIPSSLFNKDIHDGGIKSIGIRIFDNPHTVEIQKIDKDGNPKWKEKIIKGKKKFVLDKNNDKIPVTESVKVWDNMDWNIFDYVKTDYSNLTNNDFIKTMRNYKLFQYMVDKNILFSNSNISEETEERGD